MVGSACSGNFSALLLQEDKPSMNMNSFQQILECIGLSGQNFLPLYLHYIQNPREGL